MVPPYEDTAKMNKNRVEEYLAIILNRVIHTMINLPETDIKHKVIYHMNSNRQIN